MRLLGRVLLTQDRKRPQDLIPRGIVDQDNNLLYGNNERAAVQAEYERRIAEIPRLQRVLEITELELEFPGREEPIEEGELQTICVLPWLPLDEPLTFGAIRVDHWSTMREGVEEPARTTADSLLCSSATSIISRWIRRSAGLPTVRQSPSWPGMTLSG
jgi:hypothetical protein